MKSLLAALAIISLALLTLAPTAPERVRALCVAPARAKGAC